MPLTKVSEEVVELPGATPTQLASPTLPPTQRTVPNLTPLINAIRLGVAVLNARFLVLLALAGGFWLTHLVIDDPNPLKLAGLASYLVIGFLPIIWLALVKG